MPWRALEQIPAAAVSWVWRQHLGEHYGVFAGAFLERSAAPVQFYPCPHGCGCAHEVVRADRGGFVGVCRCESWNCDDLELTLEHITPLELSWGKLGRALAKALRLEPKACTLPLPGTRQVGSWSAVAVPVILTIQNRAAGLRQVVLELAGRLRRPFMLLAPTASLLDAGGDELLSQVGAGFFSLEACVKFGAAGQLVSNRTPGELFARFTPEPGEPPDEDVARRAFALVQQLDSGDAVKPPSLVAVFRLYCLETLSAEQAARRLHCSKPTVLRRLALLRAKTGLDPQTFRRFSPHLSRLEGELSDDRAERIHRRSAIYGESESEAEE